jgi:hypothetical protein
LLFILSPHVESYFFNFTLTLLSILSLFLLFYFNFFFSLLISLFFFVLHSGDPLHRPKPSNHAFVVFFDPLFFFHGSLNKVIKTQDPRQTHAHAEINPRPDGKPTPTSRSTQIGTETKTQAHPEQNHPCWKPEINPRLRSQTHAHAEINPHPDRHRDKNPSPP